MVTPLEAIEAHLRANTMSYGGISLLSVGAAATLAIESLGKVVEGTVDVRRGQVVHLPDLLAAGLARTQLTDLSIDTFALAEAVVAMCVYGFSDLITPDLREKLYAPKDAGTLSYQTRLEPRLAPGKPEEFGLRPIALQMPYLGHWMERRDGWGLNVKLISYWVTGEHQQAHESALKALSGLTAREKRLGHGTVSRALEYSPFVVDWIPSDSKWDLVRCTIMNPSSEDMVAGVAGALRLTGESRWDVLGHLARPLTVEELGVFRGRKLLDLLWSLPMSILTPMLAESEAEIKGLLISAPMETAGDVNLMRTCLQPHKDRRSWIRPSLAVDKLSKAWRDHWDPIMLGFGARREVIQALRETDVHPVRKWAALTLLILRDGIPRDMEPSEILRDGIPRDMEPSEPLVLFAKLDGATWDLYTDLAAS